MVQEVLRDFKRAKKKKNADKNGPAKLYNLFTLILNDLKEYP